MNPEKILAVLDLYEKQLVNYKVKRIAADSIWPTDIHALEHVKWMLTETKQLVADQRLEKAFIWLGFIQGVIWATGVYSIGQLKEHNRNDQP